MRLAIATMFAGLIAAAVLVVSPPASSPDLGALGVAPACAAPRGDGPIVIDCSKTCLKWGFEFYVCGTADGGVPMYCSKKVCLKWEDPCGADTIYTFQ